MLAALLAGIAVDAAVQLVYPLAARLLMQAVDVLGDDRRQLAHLLELCQRDVRRVGLCVRVDHLVKIVLKKLLGVAHKEGVAEHRLGRIGVLFLLLAAVQALVAAEIRDIRSG